jgi:hypothetical protein
VPRFNESAYINYLRRAAGDPLLEIVGLRPGPGEKEFIMVCWMMGTKTVWIRFYARDAQDARVRFHGVLSKPWVTLTTDLFGNPVPHDFDFKPSGITGFGVVD